MVVDAMLQDAKALGRDLSEFQRTVYRAFCAWGLNYPDPDVLSKGFSLEKGLLLYGGIGAGKTAIFEHFHSRRRTFWRFGFRKATMYAVKMEVMREQGEYILKYQQKGNWLLDDLGSENSPQVKVYGETMNFVDDMLMCRYEMWRQEGAFTHFTTNIGEAQLDAYDTPYHKRAVSRLHEMCNWMHMPGGDHRIKKPKTMQ